MKKTILALLLLIPAFSYFCNWDSWEVACDNPQIHIYNGTAILWNNLNLYLLKIQISSDSMFYFVPDYSKAVSSYEVPILPAKSLDEVYPREENFTFFIPGVKADKTLNLRVIGNNSDGCPICGEKTFAIETVGSAIPLDLEYNIWFDPSSHHFKFNLSTTSTSTEGLGVHAYVVKDEKVVEVYTTGFSQGVYTIPGIYNSTNVSEGNYAVYVIVTNSSNENQAFIGYSNYFEFSDFEVSIPELPTIYPGNSYSFSIHIKNVGTLADDYEIKANATAGWLVSISPLKFSLKSNEEKDININFDVPELHTGSGFIDLTISAKKGPKRKIHLTFYPEKRVILEANLEKPQEIKSYSDNAVEIAVYASGTFQPRIYWVAYTEPALFLRKGYGEGFVIRGQGNHFVSNMSVGGACAFMQDDSEGFNAGRRVLAIAKAAYYLSANMNNETVDLLNEIIDKINDEKLKMTSFNAQSLYSEAESIIDKIEAIIDAYQYGTSLQIASRREDLYLRIIDFEDKLRSAGEKMSEKCSKVDAVDFYVYIFVPETAQEKILKFSNMPVKGTTVLQLIGPTKIKAISGNTVSFDYVIKNNAAQDFDVEFETSSDIIIPPAYIVHVPGGGSKKVTFKFRPPEYMEATEMEATITLIAGTYQLDFPVKISTGKFSPEIVMESRNIYVSPGEERAYNITLQTGGLDDIFKVSFEGPQWAHVPREVVSKDGYAYITLLLSPPASVTGESYDCELEITSKSFPEYFDKKSFTIVISREAQELFQRLEDDRYLLEQLATKMSQSDYLELKRDLDAAERYIKSAEYTRAKVRLGNVERRLKVIEEGGKKEGGISPILILLLLGIAGAGFAIWKFVIQKKEEGSEEIKEIEEMIWRK